MSRTAARELVPDSPEVVDASMAPMLYFPHDSDSATDIKCKRLILRHGYEGYGRWWRLCELMAGTEGHELPCATTEDIDILCDELRCNVQELQRLVDTLTEVGLLDESLAAEGRLASDRMARNSLYFGRRRVSGRKGGKGRRQLPGGASNA